MSIIQSIMVLMSLFLAVICFVGIFFNPVHVITFMGACCMAWAFKNDKGKW